MLRTLSLAAVMALAGAASAWAVLMPQDVVDVPVQRIVANLEARLREAPRDAELHHALARAHAIAYSQGSAATVGLSPARARSPEPRPSPDERTLAAGVSPPAARDFASADEAARRHLEAALEHYREAISLAPTRLTAALGPLVSRAPRGV